MKNIQTLVGRLYNYYFAVGYNSSSDSDKMSTDEVSEGTLIDALREAGITMEQIQFVIMRAINDGEEKAIWGDKKEGFAL